MGGTEWNIPSGMIVTTLLYVRVFSIRIELKLCENIVDLTNAATKYIVFFFFSLLLAINIISILAVFFKYTCEFDIFVTAFVQEVVIMHWACSKITASLAIPDAALLEILLDKVLLPPLLALFDHSIYLFTIKLEISFLLLS